MPHTSPDHRPGALGRIASWAAALDLDFRHDARTGFGAVFSNCGVWRYLLWRWPESRGRLAGVGLLNPSRADAARDDPTIRQCRARAQQLGCSGLLVWNLFAFRATRPTELKRARDPIGPHNDAAIALALGLCRRTILGWGNHGAYRDRDRAVLDRCAEVGADLSVLGFTTLGLPRHPLYLASAVKPRRWRLTPTAAAPAQS